MTFNRTIVLYGAAIAAAAVGLNWLEYQYAIRRFPVEIYIVLLAVGFTALGIWVGQRLTRTTPPDGFEKNQRALDYLGISAREYQVLELLAGGLTNQQIADRLFVSANTVKTHLANLYAKLEVSRRTQAVGKARELNLIP